MIGILFHGPAIFDNGWAARLLKAFPDHRAMLAGTMARTALVDAGLTNVESPGYPASQAIAELATTCRTVIFCAHSSTTASGAALGGMVASKVSAEVTFVQVETNGMRWINHSETVDPYIVATVEEMGFHQAAAVEAQRTVWEENGTTYRRISAARPGDNILVNGIFIGVARSDDIVIALRDGIIQNVSDTDIKDHGLEKLVRFGPLDLAEAKVVATPHLRADPAPPVVHPNTGTGVVFIDHAAASVFELAAGCAGAVTVGDDTTAICGDILRRFSVPVLGITDGDGDGLYPTSGFAPGSTELVVLADDEAGLEVKKQIFRGKTYLKHDFSTVKQSIVELLGSRILSRNDYDE